MGYFILAPVLLADYKSAIVTCTAADCKSAETGSFLRFLIRNRFFEESIFAKELLDFLIGLGEFVLAEFHQGFGTLQLL